MAKQRRQLCMGGTHAGPHRGVAQVHAQRQGVDEHSQPAIGAGAALHSAQQHGAEHHPIMPGSRRQHLPPRQMEQARDTHAHLPRLAAQIQGQGRGHALPRFFNVMPVAAYIEQTERQRRLVDVAEHCAEERLMLLLTDAQARLRHVVAVRHGRQRRVGVAKEDRLHFLLHHGQCRVIHGDVMEQQHGDHPVVGRIACIDQTNQRCLTELDAVMPCVETLIQLRQNITGRLVECDFLHWQFGLAPHHLHRRCQALPDHPGAQDVVPAHDLTQRGGEGLQAFEAVECQARLQQVRIALRGAQVVIKNAFLQRRQRINILHVGRTTRHGGNHPFNAWLIQLQQRQQVRGDARASRRNQVGRHLDFATAAHGGGQCGEGRLAEQHAHIGAQAELTHALDQVHRQQRMAAQFEKVVVSTDLLDLQHLGPDLRQRDFHRALRSRVFAAEPGVLIRFGQGLAVEFAVGRERQHWQAHVSGGHQCLRQARLQMQAQIFDVDRRTGGEPGDQARLAHQHHRILHRRMAGQRGVDFPQFHAHATQLDLIVIAPQVLNVAIGQPAREIAGAVHARLRFVAERVFEKAFGSQLRTVQVTPGHARATDVQLAGDPDRYRTLLIIKQVDLGVAHRPADVQQLSGIDLPEGRNHRGLGRAVVVDHGKALLAVELAQTIAADQQRAQRRVLQFAAEGVFGDRRRQEAHLQRLRAPPVEQVIQVFVADRLRRQVQGRADAQRRPDFPSHRVETATGDTRGVAAGPQVERLAVPVHEVFQGRVFDHHAFRLAGGARGVNHVGQMRRGQRRQ
ncbi:hypothetical protein PseAD21_28320 [Pseudomonas sp. AD21]|nr:hypothetical protein PseAD21_28320 [Pseudomonas sp. AD21]